MSRVLTVLKVGSAHWKVIEGDNIPEDSIGVTDFTTNTITIRTGLPLDRFLVTVWHELFHVLLDSRGPILPDDVDERLCQVLSDGMADLLDENSHLFRIKEWR